MTSPLFKKFMAGVFSAVAVLLLTGCGGSGPVAPVEVAPGTITDEMTIPEAVNGKTDLLTVAFYRPMPDGSMWLCLSVWSSDAVSAVPVIQCDTAPRQLETSSQG